MELQDGMNIEANDLLALKKSVADHLLKEHTIQISTVLNLPFLMPYLIQHGCLTDEEMDHFPKTESRRTNNLKFKRMIQERGVSGFNSFLKALAHFTRDEIGEGAHKELLDSLESGVKRFNCSWICGSKSPQTSISTHQTADNARIFGPTPGERDTLCEICCDAVERDMGQPLSTDRENLSDAEGGLIVVTQEEEAGSKYSCKDTVTKEKGYRDVPEFRYFLRFAVFFTCICSPVYFIGGIALIGLSLSAFADGENCEEIVSPHSLTVFNFCCGFLCLTIPGLLIMLTIYYCCESRNSAWEREFRIISTKCLVIGTTIGFFLALFILTFMELLYALVYVAPQVYSNFGSWNATQCGSEVFLTSFWILNISSGIVVFLVAVLGVYLSLRYFRWVSDPKRPGTLRGLILAIFPQK